MTDEILRKEVRRLHGLGLTDVKIAKGLGVDKDKVYYLRRRKMKLPTARNRASEILDEKIRELYVAGMLDKDIAPLVGLSRTAVVARRAGMKLLSRRGERGLLMDQQIRELNADGMSDTEISKTIKMARTNVVQRRVNMRLKENKHDRPSRHAPDHTDYESVDRLALAWRLFSMDADVEFVAKRVGVDVETAEGYRKKMPKIWRNEIQKQEPNGERVRYCLNRGRKRGKASET